MKWNKAIEQIEKAIADGKRVEVSFHRKYARNCNEYKTDRVECVSAYDWHGETCKGVSTWDGYGLDEGNYIIDDVIVDESKTEEPAAEEPETEEGSETMKVKNVLATVWPTNKVNIAVYSNGLKVYDTWDEGICEARECHDINSKYLNANVAEIFAARDTAAEDEYKNAMAVLCIRADI